MSDNEFLDLALLQDYIDNIGTDVVLQMLDLYIQQSIIYLDNIGNASVGDSQTEWHDTCHKMKGAAGSIGLKKVHAKLVIIESSTASTAIKQEEVVALRELNHSAIEIMQDWLKSK